MSCNRQTLQTSPFRASQFATFPTHQIQWPNKQCAAWGPADLSTTFAASPTVSHAAPAPILSDERRAAILELSSRVTQLYSLTFQRPNAPPRRISSFTAPPPVSALHYAFPQYPPTASWTAASSASPHPRPSPSTPAHTNTFAQLAPPASNIQHVPPAVNPFSTPHSPMSTRPTEISSDSFKHDRPGIKICTKGLCRW